MDEKLIHLARDIVEKISKEIKKENLEKVAYEVVFSLVPVLGDMEFEGVKIDKVALDSFSNELKLLITNYTKKIHKIAGDIWPKG